MKIEEYRKIREHLEAARDIIDESRYPVRMYSNEKIYGVPKDKLDKIDHAILLYIFSSIDLVNDRLETLYMEDLQGAAETDEDKLDFAERLADRFGMKTLERLLTDQQRYELDKIGTNYNENDYRIYADYILSKEAFGNDNLPTEQG